MAEVITGFFAVRRSFTGGKETSPLARPPSPAYAQTTTEAATRSRRGPDVLVGSGADAPQLIGLPIFMVQVDYAEAVAVQICKHDKVGVVWVSIPLHTFSAERNQTLYLHGLLSGIGNMQVKVKTGVLIGRAFAALKCESRTCAVVRLEDYGPTTESIPTHVVVECLRPEARSLVHIRNTDGNDPYLQHHLIVPVQLWGSLAQVRCCRLRDAIARP